MQTVNRRSFLACVAGIALAPGGARSAPANNDFKLFDATLYKDKPGTLQGLRPIGTVYESLIWGRDAKSQELPDLRQFKLQVKEIAAHADFVVIDVERFRVEGAGAPVEESVLKLSTVLRAARDALPGKSVGLYGTIPLRNYWDAIKPSASRGHQAWQAANDRLTSLLPLVDVLYPSLYTFYDDFPGWLTFAKVQIAEARRLGKDREVIPFLWPQYHDSNARLKGTYLPAEVWRRQLEACANLADGAVVWGGYQEAWDDNAAWWLATREFMSSRE